MNCYAWDSYLELDLNSSYNCNNIKETLLKLPVETWFKEFHVSRWSGKFWQANSTMICNIYDHFLLDKLYLFCSIDNFSSMAGTNTCFKWRATECCLKKDNLDKVKKKNYFCSATNQSQQKYLLYPIQDLSSYMKALLAFLPYTQHHQINGKCYLKPFAKYIRHWMGDD